MTLLLNEFMTAVKTNDAKKVAELLAEDSGLVNAKVGDNSAVLTATYYGAKDVTKLLMDNGASLNVFEAAAIGNTEKVLEHVTNDPNVLSAYAHDGFQALGLASFFGHLDTVKALLSMGAEVNSASTNPLKVMPLHSSVAHKQLEISELLIQHGADVNTKQQEGFTPLLEAVQNGQIEMVQLLLDAGADVNLQKDDGETPYSIAKKHGHDGVANLLLERGGK